MTGARDGEASYDHSYSRRHKGSTNLESWRALCQCLPPEQASRKRY